MFINVLVNNALLGGASVRNESELYSRDFGVLHGHDLSSIGVLSGEVLSQQLGNTVEESQEHG